MRRRNVRASNGGMGVLRSRFAMACSLLCFSLPVATEQAIAADVSRATKAAIGTAAVVNPILFVTQVPIRGGAFASRAATFANHLGDIGAVPRGGDLMIRYPDGSVRNLTQEAGLGMSGAQSGANAIAVREPSVHWSGTKAIFSMVKGAPTRQYDYNYQDVKWQLYEVTGLGQGQTVSITKVPGQPANYNNVSPLYDTNDKILFTSDRPVKDLPHLYPQFDEYESTAIVTGLWRLDPIDQSVRLLNHTPSGLFSPSIDSFGRVIFIRWDHLQRDQQADGSPGNGLSIDTFVSEAAGAATIPDVSPSHNEVFPESRAASVSSSFGPVRGRTHNIFQLWEMNQDGTAELTLNHMGAHELSFGYLERSFINDNALSDYTNEAIKANQRYVRGDGGLFHAKEDPASPGNFYAMASPEFGTNSSGNIVRVTGAPTLNAEQMTIDNVTVIQDSNGAIPGGRMRDPLPMSNGALVASHSASTVANDNMDFRLKELVAGAGGLKVPGTALTPGISKSISWWDPDAQRTFSGNLWEIEAVEVVARTRPTPRVATVETVEQQVLAEEGVSESALKQWLIANELALIVTRNQTSRDRSDKQQPFNLRVPGGVSTTTASGTVYDIAHYQIFQADQVRGYTGRQGRRSLARPIAQGKNPANAGGPAGSVKIAADGSTAAFVPANRALTWQTTNPSGEPVVRERMWLTMQPGEIRTCGSCHGINSVNQKGEPPPVNKPQALRDLLTHWKSIGGPAAALPFDIDGSGACESATDAVLLARYLSGTRGPNLIAGLTFASNASRKTFDVITLYLEGLGNTLDIDGDGQKRSTTDGALFARYTRLLSGANLTAGVRAGTAGVGGVRTDQEIKNYLDSKCLATQ